MSFCSVCGKEVKALEGAYFGGATGSEGRWATLILCSEECRNIYLRKAKENKVLMKDSFLTTGSNRGERGK